MENTERSIELHRSRRPLFSSFTGVLFFLSEDDHDAEVGGWRGLDHPAASFLFQRSGTAAAAAAQMRSSRSRRQQQQQQPLASGRCFFSSVHSFAHSFAPCCCFKPSFLDPASSFSSSEGRVKVFFFDVVVVVGDAILARSLARSLTAAAALSSCVEPKWKKPEWGRRKEGTEEQQRPRGGLAQWRRERAARPRRTLLHEFAAAGGRERSPKEVERER